MLPSRRCLFYRQKRTKEAGAKASCALTESASAGSVYARVDAAATDLCVAVTPRPMPPSATYCAMSALPGPTSRWRTRVLVKLIVVASLGNLAPHQEKAEMTPC
ncbi:uncharacterized protein LOC125035981 [Penaeus chinensis]|uniref:uncharacterized protein LOC125035981 n=1 Tax=Penaeus chinensis TaxID=139456 RepID=UPI001FB7EFCB|nr:uncharacterized protein LOC125035981 [Penaeus chinensis]